MYSTNDLRNENVTLLRRINRQRESNQLKEYKKQKMVKDKDSKFLNNLKFCDKPFKINQRNMKKKESRGDYNLKLTRLGLYLDRRGL